jgi:hypothetical protein
MSPEGEVRPVGQGALAHFEQTQIPAVSRLQTLIAPLCLQTMTTGLNVAPNSGTAIFMRGKPKLGKPTVLRHCLKPCLRSVL